MDEIQRTLLKEVADLDALPVGAYNIRSNGAAAGRNSTANIEIVPKEDKRNDHCRMRYSQLRRRTEPA